MRFGVFRFLAVVILAALGVPSIAADVPEKFDIDLFVQNNVDHRMPNRGNSFDEDAEGIIAHVEFEKSVAMVRAIDSALIENRMDDFNQLVAEYEAYEKTARYVRGILNREKRLIKFYQQDFQFLCNVDSVKLYNFVNEKSILYGILQQQKQSGMYEAAIEKIENESDRVFVQILFNNLFEDKLGTSKRIEKHRTQLKNLRQLHYLVDNYWIERSELDLHNYFSYSAGFAMNKFVGRISDKVKNGFGLYNAVGFVMDDIFAELFLGVNTAQSKELDSISFWDAGVDLNLGYTLLNKEYVHLYGFLTAGFAVDELEIRRNDKKDNYSFPSQYYPTYGAGFMVDVFFTSLSETHFGLRLRGGIKNVWADDVVNASGFRLYASIEWLIHEYSRKNNEFDYLKKGRR
jgi:hypothetical protein